MSKEVKGLYIGSIAFVVLVMLRNLIPLHNMEFYVVSCAVFAAAALLAYLVMGTGAEAGCCRSADKGGAAAERLWSISAAVLLLLWMALFYVNETNTQGALDESVLIRRYFPFPLWITLMAAGTGICLFLLGREAKEKTLGIRKRLRLIVSLAFTFGVSIQFYAPNIFQDIQGGTYHSHAYTNSIINVCWMIPYSEDMECLYGHYGILYMPFLRALHRFFHLDYLTGIFLLSAVIGGISILLFLYILNYFAKDDVIFYLGMLAIGEEYFMNLQGGVYLQVHPHRMIFPMLLLFLVLQEYRKQKKYSILAICALTLSFVWSTEVGIVTMVSFALYRWVLEIMDGEAFSLRKALKLVPELALFAALPFALSYGVISGYNLLAGGGFLDFPEFMFPLISDRGYIDQIELPLPDVTHAWIGTSVLFLGAMLPAVFRVLFPVREERSRKPFYFFLGIMSLMIMLYYINRPVEGSLFIILFLMLIWQAVILQKGQEVYRQWKAAGKDCVFQKPDRFLFLVLRVVTVFILFIMAFDCVYSAPKAWRTSARTVWKRDELMEFAQYVYNQVPPDAVSFGEGVPELMSMIDRDTNLHTTEWSYLNMPLDTMERVRGRLEKEQWFFCSLYSLWYLQENYPGLTDNYYLHEEFEYNGAKFGFFRVIAEDTY